MTMTTGIAMAICPSWPRISAALVLALGAEAAHWGHSQWPALHYLGMALTVVAIALPALGIYRQGLTDLAIGTWASMP